MRAGTVAVVATALFFSACGSATPQTVVRSADDVQVMSPGQVKTIRDSMAPLTTTPPSLAPGDTTALAAAGGSVPGTAVGDTVPLNKDNRPPELRLFDAYAKFKSCIEDAGYTIQGNLQDPKNPAYKDPEYVKVVTTCAARTGIVQILQEMQATRASLTPPEVEVRNKAFKLLQKCLQDRGWTIETTTDKIGLINPSKFQAADGTLNQRDIDQCLSETGINDAVNGNG
jgi:hypothetical protein